MGKEEPWYDRSAVAKALAGEAALAAGHGPGAARGAWRLLKGLPGDLVFASRLANPLDPIFHPSGGSARDELAMGLANAALQVKAAADHPQATIALAKDRLHDWHTGLDPYATRQAQTLRDEVFRNWRIGLNQGELSFNVGSLIAGGAELDGVRGARLAARLGAATKGSEGLSLLKLGVRGPTAADYTAQRTPRELADYFALPYTGRGHHYWPLREPLPAALGGGPMPKSVGESPFFLLKPKGITNGEFYLKHFRVDPKYWGGRVKAGYPVGRWSGKELGWEKYGKFGRYWHGAPQPLKTALTSPFYAAAGVTANMVEDSEDDQ